MIDKLEMFIALARERHFGRAAEAVGVTQPTLSAAIRQLEAQLGVQLVWRGARFEGLTPEGQRVLDWARRIVGDARSLREEMRALRQGLSGNLRLAVIPTALTAASALTAAFARANPNVRLTVRSRTSAEILEAIENLSIDAGISYLDNEPVGRVTTVPLFSERYCLVVPAGHALAGRDRLGWAEVAGLPLCLLTPDMQNRRLIDRHLEEAGVAIEPRIESNSITLLVAHLRAGDWATILPARAAELHTSDGVLRAIPLSEPDVAHAVGLLAPWREPHTPVLAALLQAAATMAKSWAD